MPRKNNININTYENDEEKGICLKNNININTYENDEEKGIGLKQ